MNRNRVCLFLSLLFCGVGRTSAGEFLPIRENNRWGFMDENGKVKIVPVYTEIKSFSHGLAVVRFRGKGWGIIDTLNRVVLNPKYSQIIESADGSYFLVVRKGRVYSFDRNNWSLKKTMTTIPRGMKFEAADSAPFFFRCLPGIHSMRKGRII